MTFLNSLNNFLLLFKAQKLSQVFTIYLRYLIGFAWVFASIVKIEGKRFTIENGINSPINSASHLFETLYQSNLYWSFLGVCQLFAGFLLLTQVYSIIGAIISFPIILNIFIITISYEFGGTSYITFLMLLSNLYLIIWDWDIIKVLFLPKKYTYIKPDINLMKHQSWVYLGFLYFVLIILFKKYVFSFFTLFFYVVIMFLIGIIVTVYNLKKK